MKPSDIHGTVDTLFPEVILCVEIYNSRKFKVTSLICEILNALVIYFFEKSKPAHVETKVLVNRYKLIRHRGKNHMQTPLTICVKFFVQIQEFLVLGSQMLTELKDKIHCVTDQVMEKAGKYDPSGYFLIEVRTNLVFIFLSFDG